MKFDANWTDEEASTILNDMRWRAGTLFRALDADGDGVLSPEEISLAPIVLRGLDHDGDGYLREEDLGGPTLVPGLVRRSGIVRLLDEDGDLLIGPDDISEASERILLLDQDGDGRVTAEDDLPLPGSNVENRMPMGTPAQNLAYQQKMFTRSPDMTGPMMPRGQTGVQPGLMLIHEVNDRSDVQKSNRTFLMDDMGQIVHSWRTRNRLPEATVAYLLPNGNLLRTTCQHSWLVMDGLFPIGTSGTISILAKDSTVLWEWTHFEPGKEALHHDVEMMPNGNLLVISWIVFSAKQAGQLGWIQQNAHERVVLDRIYEIRPDVSNGETEIVWAWSVHDHAIQNVNPDLPTYGDPAKHPGKIDINWPCLDVVQFNSGQLFHTNSVSYNPEEDIILLSSAVFGEIWMIDHSTSKHESRGSTGGRYGCGGDLIWRWGNPQTHGRGGPDDQVLFWQHDAHFLTAGVPHAGDLLIFNNGMRRDADGRPEQDQICMGMITGAYSDILELKLPRKASGRINGFKQPDIVWSLNSDACVGIYSPFMSGAQRLPNGNTLFVQGCDKRIIEISPENEIVLDFHVGGPGRMFRIYKYSPNFPGIAALGL